MTEALHVMAEAAEKLPEAARMRLKLWDISDAQIAELRRTRKVGRTLTLYAPISGIVSCASTSFRAITSPWAGT